MAGPPPSAPAGYYPAPDGQGQRYWDGAQWAVVSAEATVPESKTAFLRDLALVRYESKGNFIAKLFSFRLMFGALLVGLLVAVLPTMLFPPLGIIWLPVSLAVWWLGAANPGHVLYCPWCRKRVKAGADVCHHCGRTVADDRPPWERGHGL